jgi:hypothetical protein
VATPRNNISSEVAGQAMEQAASVAQTMAAINTACKAQGGARAGYSCKTVSWDDVSRGTVGGSLSCWGANITDTYLKSKTGEKLFTVRSDNWNERLGKVSTDQVALITGNQARGGQELRPITLREFLQRGGVHGAYAGLQPETDLSNDDLDQQVSIRFQTTFLPVASDVATTQFATEAYNYNTRSDDDPRNLLLLCTTQGVAVQQDGAGAKRVFHHAVDADGVIHQYWLEAERSQHQVGGAQEESEEERADAVARGKATAAVIGTRAMGTRFNVLMTVQVPLQQQAPTLRRASCSMLGKGYSCGPTPAGSAGRGGGGYSRGRGRGRGSAIRKKCAAKKCARRSTGVRSGAKRLAPPPRCGQANAARVSRGAEVGVWSGLRARAPKRNPSEHITVTVVIYNTVAGGVPSVEDVTAAIDDMEALYSACSADGRLVDSGFDFMKTELTVHDAQQINQKLQVQPYSPASVGVTGGEVFPS